MRQSHDLSYRRSVTPQPPQPRPTSPYHPNNYNQSVQGASSSIGWSAPSGPTQGQAPVYPVPGGRPQRGASPQPRDRIYRSDTGDYSSTYTPLGNATPTRSVSHDEYVMISITSHCPTSNLYFSL